MKRDHQRDNDLQLEERLRRFLVLVDPSGVWDDIEQRAQKEASAAPEGLLLSGRAGERAGVRGEEPTSKTPVWRVPATRRPSGLRVAVFACLAVVLLAGAAFGALQAVKYLGEDQSILVITDDTSGISLGSTGASGSSGQTGSTTARGEVASVEGYEAYRTAMNAWFVTYDPYWTNSLNDQIAHIPRAESATPEQIESAKGLADLVDKGVVVLQGIQPPPESSSLHSAYLTALEGVAAFLDEIVAALEAKSDAAAFAALWSGRAVALAEARRSLVNVLESGADAQPVPTTVSASSEISGETSGESQGVVSGEVKALLENWLIAANQGDVPALGAIYAETAVFDDLVSGSLPGRKEGRARIVDEIAYRERNGRGFEVRGEPVQFGPYVAQAVVVMSDGTPVGEGVHVFEINGDGEIAHQWFSGHISAE